MVSRIKDILKNNSELLTILLIVVVCLIAGLKSVGDYGESSDEAIHFYSAEFAVNDYQYFFHPAQLPPFSPVLGAYGPAYYIGVLFFARALQFLHPAWVDPVAWHFSYFLTFIACIVILYLFVRRWFGYAASLATSLLFATQPLLWGHAFINPKDTPFMAFFLASVYLGFEMVDHYFSARPKYLLVAVSAVMLGLTISFRIAGPLAGLLVCIYALSKSGRKSIRLLGLYLLIAAVVSYLTWPFVWGNPIQNIVNSLATMSQFPFARKALFMGRYLGGDELPWYYFPVILGIQFTLPAVLLALLGLGVAVLRFVRRRNEPRGPLFLFLGWFLVPLVGIYGVRSTLYDNGRQLFFILPPLFILMGLALDTFLPLLRFRWVQGVVILLLMIPGLYGMMRLHPYEYTYYNQLVGSTRGASGKYELDYWGTSFREVALWLDAEAPANAKLWVAGPVWLLKPYLRSDMIISCSEENDCGGHYDYMVAPVRWKLERNCPHVDPVFTVSRGGAIFAVVKQLGDKRCK